MQSCTQNDSTIPTVSIEQRFRLSKELATEAPELTHINAYVFSAGVLINRIENLPITESTITVEAPANAQIYFLAGFSTWPASLTSLEVNKTSIETFLSLRSDLVTEAQAGSATLFFTGYYQGSDGADASVHEILMTRSVARIDLDTTSDPLIKINRIVANNVLLSSLLFRDKTSATNDMATGTAEKLFDTPVSGTHEACMYLFESPSPISLTLYGTYQEKSISVSVTIPLVNRNHIYTVRVNNTGAQINGSISTTPWEQEDVIESKPDLNQRVSIDTERTIVSEGMTIDKETNHILVSEKGGNLALVLAAETALEIVSIEGDHPLLTIDNPTVATAGNKLVTTIPIAVTEQEKGRIPYQVRINLKSPLTQNSYDFITIDVEGNRDQIPTVSFGGLEVMAFNTTGAKLSEQYYLPEGTSILDAYTNHWAECTGRMFQFGRTPGYYPHERTPSQPPPSFTVWDESNGAPCPEGFRMPTSAEMYKIFPQSKSNIPINGSVSIPYILNKKLAELKIIVPDKKISMGEFTNITPRYVRLVCEQDTLFFPMAGYNNAYPISNHIGEWFFMMASNRDAEYTRAYGYAAPIWKNQHNDIQQRMLKNFNFVRCVKK